MIENDLYAVLGPLVAGHCYPLRVPEGVKGDALVYTRVAGVPETDLQGASSLINARYQIDVWASEYATSRALAQSARTTLAAASAFTALWLGDQDLTDPDTRRFRVILEFSIWYTE